MNLLMSLTVHRTLLQRRQWLATAGLGALLTACGGGSGSGGSDVPAGAALDRWQEGANALVTQGLVGAAVGWADAHQTRTAVAGLRRLGNTAQLAPGDLMGIGSNTKAMTACVAASVVDQGLLRWDSTLAQALPGLASEALPVYRNVTLRDLLDHRAGVMAFTGSADIDAFARQVGDEALVSAQQPAERQALFLRWLLQQPPVAATGEIPGYAYSNAGYILASRMLADATGQDWSTLLQRRVAQPLGLSLFVGTPLRQGPDQPSGHQIQGGRLKPVALPEALEQAWGQLLDPAGGVSLRVQDDAVWLQWHLRALRGEATPLPTSYVRALQATGRDTASNYALGWVVQPWQGGHWLLHSGELGGFQALSIVALDGSAAALAHSNTSTPDSMAWLFDSVAALMA